MARSPAPGPARTSETFASAAQSRCPACSVHGPAGSSPSAPTPTSAVSARLPWRGAHLLGRSNESKGPCSSSLIHSRGTPSALQTPPLGSPRAAPPYQATPIGPGCLLPHRLPHFSFSLDPPTEGQVSVLTEVLEGGRGRCVGPAAPAQALDEESHVGDDNKGRGQCRPRVEFPNEAIALCLPVEVAVALYFAKRVTAEITSQGSSMVKGRSGAGWGSR